jgi:hypothetical protein
MLLSQNLLELFAQGPQSLSIQLLVYASKFGVSLTHKDEHCALGLRNVSVGGKTGAH